MRLITFSDETEKLRVGAVSGDTLIDVAAALRRSGEQGPEPGPVTVTGLLTASPQVREAVAEAVATAAASGLDVARPIELCAPVPDPPRIFAIGRNYAAHAREGQSDVPDFPMIFLKPATTLVGHCRPVLIPPTTDQVDWEGELAVVIGVAGKHISEADALAHVGGYTVANDVTARDWQRRTSQFDAGKMFDTFCPLGPALVTPEEFDPAAAAITTTVNGVTMQDGNTRDMIFSVAALVSYLSGAVRLLPGDIVLTGTPAGVGYARATPIFLVPGDEVSVTIDGLGTLTSPVAAEG